MCESHALRSYIVIDLKATSFRPEYVGKMNFYLSTDGGGMSIYETLWALRFPKAGQFYADCEWVTVIARSAPAHVGADGDDPYELFLPALSASVADGLRAVAFIVPWRAKGTPRSAQEYEAPSLVISGAEYAALSFAVLHARLCNALRGSQPVLVAEVLLPEGSWKLVFEDGSVVGVAGSKRNNWG